MSHFVRLGAMVMVGAGLALAGCTQTVDPMQRGAGGVLLGAGTGAALGTAVFPGIGTALGAAVGAGVGATTGVVTTPPVSPMAPHY